MVTKGGNLLRRDMIEKMEWAIIVSDVVDFMDEENPSKNFSITARREEGLALNGESTCSRDDDRKAYYCELARFSFLIYGYLEEYFEEHLDEFFDEIADETQQPEPTRNNSESPWSFDEEDTSVLGW